MVTREMAISSTRRLQRCPSEIHVPVQSIISTNLERVSVRTVFLPTQDDSVHEAYCDDRVHAAGYVPKAGDLGLGRMKDNAIDHYRTLKVLR